MRLCFILQAVLKQVGEYFLMNLPVNFYGDANMDIRNEVSAFNVEASLVCADIWTMSISDP